jgi:hypothetical protein
MGLVGYGVIRPTSVPLRHLECQQFRGERVENGYVACLAAFECPENCYML